MKGSMSPEEGYLWNCSQKVLSSSVNRTGEAVVLSHLAHVDKIAGAFDDEVGG